MSNRHDEIMNGTLVFPKQLLNILKPNKMELSLTEEFWRNLWHNFLNEKSTDTLSWYKKFDSNTDYFNQLIFLLCDSKWISSIISGNYAWLQLQENKILKWISNEELLEIRKEYKYNKYLPHYQFCLSNDLVKVNHTIKHTGLVREGFRKSGTIPFSYDIQYVEEYKDEIYKNICKGILDNDYNYKYLPKDINYAEIVNNILDIIISKPDNWYSLGKIISDSRGRAIHQCVKKVFNPISCKEARASMILPHSRPLSKQGEEDVYLFIAELLGYKPSTIEEKIVLGKEAYEKRITGDEAYTQIWLSRLYKNLENPKYFNTPIEIDATASVLQFMGILINSHELLHATNLAEHEFLQDAWSIPGISRLHVKKCITPRLYGSSAPISALMDKNHFVYNANELDRLYDMENNSIYRHAIKFKEFIIDSCKPSSIMNINILHDNFTVYCNKFKWETSQKQEYHIYSSGLVRTLSRTKALEPDLDRFKLFMPTLLVHNLDSQVADSICKIFNCFPVHDCFIVHPNDAHKVRKAYKNCMSYIYRNRKKILKQFFNSIGIHSPWKDIDQGELKLSGYALK